MAGAGHMRGKQIVRNVNPLQKAMWWVADSLVCAGERGGRRR